jgi:hypothetical protein
MYISPKTQKLYNKVFLQLEVKDNIESQRKALMSLEIKISILKKNKKYKNNKGVINLFNQILYLNDKKIKEILKIKESWNIKKIEKSKNYNKEYGLEKIRRKKIVEKYDYSKYFKNISLSKNNIFLENWIWKAYIINNYSFFPKELYVRKKDLEYNWINLNTDLLFVTKENTLWFVKNPTKVNLISDEIIKNIDNKYYFLEELVDDVRTSWVSSYDKYFLELKSKTEKITNNLDENSKIENIYNYILKNTSYSKTIDFENYKIFSWIETFKNNDWVCEGYAKLMVYMLMFAWINEVDAIRGYVIDAKDFPKVWHAWVSVWDKYYDPTFDDPVWALQDKGYTEYKYFDLPRDLFYTNRYDKKDLPEKTKTLSLENRKKIILYNLNKVSKKYKNSKYRLLELIKLKKKYNFKYDEKITLENFDNILPKYLVDNFIFFKNGTKKQILKLQYYNIDDFDLELLLEQIDYNLDWYYFFKWYDENKNKTYRLWHSIETN